MQKRKIGRPSKSDAVDRKKLVLDAAIEQISELGFERFTLAQVGKRAGVAPALIRHYFSSKDGLVAECTATVNVRLEKHWVDIETKILNSQTGTLLQALIDIFQERYREERVVLGYLCWLFLKGGKDADELYTVYYDSLIRVITQLKQRRVMSQDVSSHWFAQQCISMQMGPYFLAKPIGSQLGGDPFADDVSKERSIATLRTLTAAAQKPPPRG